MFWENATQPLTQVLLGSGPAALREVWAVVGPEGGLASAEVELLSSFGYQPAGLGEGILRVETAAVVASALLLDRMRA